MNIFITSECPIESALALPVVLRNKMIVEGCQMLSTAHRVLDGDAYADDKSLYKKTHHNHPSAVSIQKSRDGYNWLFLHTVALAELYQEHTGKIHLSCNKFQALEIAPISCQNNSFQPTIAAPDQFKQIANSFTVFRGYQEYLNFKFREWSSREKPVKLEWPFGKPSWLSL